MCSTVLIEQGVQHGAYGTVLQDNLRCFGINYDMSRVTHFLCYFLSLKLASVLSYYAFPSLVVDDDHDDHDDDQWEEEDLAVVEGVVDVRPVVRAIHNNSFHDWETS